MILQTQIPIKKASIQIDYNSKLLLLGSCFSENIGRKLDYFKFQVVQNPFGILFHPVAIEKLIVRAIQQETYTEKDVFFLNERWHCFDAHSDLSDTSAQKLINTLNAALVKTRAQLLVTTHLSITLGTAWVYRNSDSGQVVANCHKVPQKQFTKELLGVNAIQQSLQNTMNAIQTINKNVEVVFTVSPVRHIKDGFVENKRSKAHLISAVHESIETSNFPSRISYFPSFELMMDELRDYRFYTADMIHPNETAVDYIWEKFKFSFVAEDAYTSMDKIETIQKGLAHRPFNSASEGHQKFLKSLKAKVKAIKKVHPFIDFKTL